MKSFPLLICGLFAVCLPTHATQETEAEPFVPVEKSKANPEADVFDPALAEFFPAVSSTIRMASGPITAATSQPTGALSGRVMYMSGGHGWQSGSSTWSLDRPLLLEMNEDMGNVDQMTLYAYYCFNAGATVVPMRPVGNQTNEVVIDNDDPQVTWSGAWQTSGSAVYFGSAGDAVPYRFTEASSNEAATATYTPNIPVADLYPVYCWALGGNNRVKQLYRINHTGGQSLVRVPHNLVGGGWVYLGTYYFNAGSNSASGSVQISNLGEPGASGAVIADAIRFGNGRGSINSGAGISTYPREDEGNRYWIQAGIGQGRSSTIYSGNVSSPIRMAAEMNNEGSGNMYKRAYVGFHSNATTGNPTTATSRGVLALWNDESDPDAGPGTATPNQRDYALRLATEINNDMVSLNSQLEVSWGSRSGNALLYNSPTFAYGELNGLFIDDEFDATIVEVAFHDNTNDVRLLRDPKARSWIARSTVHGMIRYMNAYDGAPLSFAPEPPHNVRAVAEGNDIRIAWDPPTAQAGTGSPAYYKVYQSRDGYGFGQPIQTPGAGFISTVISNAAPGTDYYFRVAAVNAGGESMPSEVVGCRIATDPLSSRILIVNGFMRFDRTLNLRQNLTAKGYKAPGHDKNSGAIERVWPRRINSFDYVVPHGKAIAASSMMAFDSCQLRAATNSTVALTNYQIVIWNAGNQSTKERTFNDRARTNITAFLAGGGHLFVSGSDVAYDLGRSSASSAEKQFLSQKLRVVLGSDANNNSAVYTSSAVSGGIFAGNASIAFDDGSKGIYWVPTPDAVTASGAGASPVLTYPGYSGGAAAVRYNGSAGDGKVVFLGFPFETITSSAIRTQYMADVLRDFSRTPVLGTVSAEGGNLDWTVTAEPGLTYVLEASPDAATWAFVRTLQNNNGVLSISEPIGSEPGKFFRIRTL